MPHASPYVPQPDSLAGRVCQYLQANPREELDAVDLVSRFGVVQRQIQPNLEAPIRHGLIETFLDSTGTRGWRAGPKLGALNIIPIATRQLGMPAPVAAASSVFDAGKAARRARGPGKLLPAIDAHALKVRTDVPVPLHGADRRHIGGKYDALFAKLSGVGHSFVVDPLYIGALKSAAKKYGKEAGMALTVRKTPDGQCGVWRIK